MQCWLIYEFYISKTAYRIHVTFELKNVVWQLPEEIRQGNTSKNWQKNKYQLGVLEHFLGICSNYTWRTTTYSGQWSQDNYDNLICTSFHLGCMSIVIVIPSSVYVVLRKCYFSDETVLKIPFIQQSGKNIPQIDKLSYIFVVSKNR